jgi:hypothetical protein
MASIHINARRWFERTNGNTYHSVSVLVDGAEIGVAPFSYGYDEHYMVTAGKLLQAFAPELAPDDAYDLGRWTWRESSGHTITSDVVDVQRKRDLHNGGRALKVNA